MYVLCAAVVAAAAAAVGFHNFFLIFSMHAKSADHICALNVVIKVRCGFFNHLDLWVAASIYFFNPSKTWLVITQTLTRKVLLYIKRSSFVEKQRKNEQPLS